MKEKKPIRFSRGKVAELLKSDIDGRSVAYFAGLLGVSRASVYFALRGDRPPCKAILSYMGLRRITTKKVTKTEAYEQETRRP